MGEDVEQASERQRTAFGGPLAGTWPSLNLNISDF